MMLDRADGIATDHGARMDGIYRSQRHIYDATRKYYLLGRDRLIRSLDAQAGFSVLEIGCGTGRNLITAAKAWPEAHFCGLDISAAMLETASEAVVKHGLGSRVALAQADATHFNAGRCFGREMFDRIFLSYTLSMIPGWELAIDEAADVLAPGGAMHIVDFGQQEGLPAVFRNGLFAWLAHFHVQPRGDLKPVLEDVAQRRRLTLEFTPLYRGYAWAAVLRAPA
ncbi:MAG TPA: class I SAM-dependent methyltransferase [Sphingobium sp.]